jgi:opacity protein-like surface antigen
MRGSLVASVVISATALVGMSSGVRAADIPAKGVAPVAYSAFAPHSGWYAYVGASIPLTRPTDSLKEEGCVFLCGGSSKLGADDAAGVIFGAGYRWNQHFRTDLRIGHGWAAVSGTTTRLPPAIGAGAVPIVVPDTGQTTGNISGWGGGLNFYWDLRPTMGAWLGNFEPFVGVGVGYARVAFSNFTYASPAVGTFVWPNVVDSAFGYTLTAGTGYRLTRNWVIDVAYIWRDFGTFKSQAISPSALGAAAPPTVFSGDLSGHAVDVGVRYEF